MSIFSKTVICEDCGKEFITGRFSSDECCDECVHKWWVAEENKKGYEIYNKYDNDIDEYSDSIEKKLEHRDAILEKASEGILISAEQLVLAGTNCDSLSDEEMNIIILRSAGITVNLGNGYVETSRFIAPTMFNGAIIDKKDVFAVAFTNDYHFSDDTNEGLLCTIFTNDKYIKVFPALFFVDKGLFDIVKSSKGRKNVQEIITDMFPNLTYKVDDMKLLKNTLKKEKTVRGNLELRFMLDIIADAQYSSGMFKSSRIKDNMQLSLPLTELVNKHGFYTRTQIYSLLGMGNKKNNTYFKKLAKRLLKQNIITGQYIQMLLSQN